ncbi:serine/threonine-protein kinase Sgk2b isoform X2 [Syngnathoides biaculeatus]|uniref:serine/threonine-protein kinase Sgk2b isoform X2 n=1 Tax=Syngnathoides biaculeatus TaxID=300417 RepID=UPI002ADE63D5|nr:serine/threonine-protein kinase Sgk2b isoform X2 [Syngnathoides biaculeatus]
MTRTRGRAMTCAEMRRLASFFAALLKGRKFLFRELLHKVAPYQPLCQHQEDACRIRRPRSKKWEKLRDGSGRGTAVSKENGSLKSQTSRMKPSDFDYLKVIGKGSFGKVLLAKHRKDGGCYAVKVLHKQTIVMRKEQQHVMVERSVLLKGLQHPFLVGLRFAFQTPNLLYFVVDYVNGGELFYHLQNEGSFPESRAAFYAAEISMALGYLHSLDVVYRDLKPENILLDCEGHVKLTDFGLCKEGVAAGEVMQTFCGTPEYLAPEVLLGHAYGPAVDWWGLGSVLFEMLYGHPPFYSRSKAEMFAKIVHEPLRLRSGTSEAARSLLGGLLERKVSRRLGERRDVVRTRAEDGKTLRIRMVTARRIFVGRPGGAAGAPLLFIRGLGRPAGQESGPPVRPQCDESLRRQLRRPRVHAAARAGLRRRRVPRGRGRPSLRRLLLRERLLRRADCTKYLVFFYDLNLCEWPRVVVPDSVVVHLPERDFECL